MKKCFKIIFLCLALILSLFPLAASASSYSGASTWAVPELDKAEAYDLITERVKNNVSANITREEFAEIAVRLYEKCTGKKASSGTAAFNDTTNAEILKAANIGLVNGVGGGGFAPGQLVTREQMAAILLRTLKVISPASDFSTAGAAKFADDGSISSWAWDGVYYCAKKGIIKGVGGNKFSPKGNSTREAAIIVCTRSYELYRPAGENQDNNANSGNSTNPDSQNGSGGQSGTASSAEEVLVINDYEFKAGDYVIRENGQGTFIFIPLDKFKYAFIYPYSANNKYPDVIERDGAITVTWKDGQDLILEISLNVDSAEAVINGQPVDITAGPFLQDGKIMIPVNIFVEALEMKSEEFMGRAYLQYSSDFTQDMLTGSWYYSNTNIFTGFKDLVTGLVSLPSFDTSYTFKGDGTYNLGMVSTGGFNDLCIVQGGKYKVIGNTIIYYDIVETVYEGNPFKEKYKNKNKEAPEYDFINNFNAEEDKIEIDGFWLHRP